MVSKSVVVHEDIEYYIPINSYVNKLYITIYLLAGVDPLIQTEQKIVEFKVLEVGGVNYMHDGRLIINETGIKMEMAIEKVIDSVIIATYHNIGQTSSGVWALVSYD